MSEAPRVSVLIATYNRAGMVVGAIDSVLRQSFRDLEIIVADDGSTDDTTQRIAVIEGPVDYVRLEHSGLIARGRNEGLNRARGELIAFLDDDDCWEPEKLARQVAVLDADPEIGLVYTGFSVLGDDGSVHVPELAPWQIERGLLFGPLLRGCFIHPSTVLVRRVLLDRIGGFAESRAPCEDYDLWLRLASVTRGACIAEPLARLRRGAVPNSIIGRPKREVDIHHASISILEDWLASGELGLRLRLRCRTAIANLHLSAARLASQSGDQRRARRHAIAALGRSPFRRGPWTGLVHYLLPQS
jgi:glycosyltransferase involved in cell wall biosynthesis